MSDSTKKVKVIIIVSAAIAVLAMAAVVITFVLNSSTRKVSRYLSIANEYYANEDYNQAISEFENVLSIDERNVDAYLGIADAYEELADAAGEKGNYKKEEKYLKKALKTLEEGYDITDDDEIKDRIEDISEKVEKAEKNKEDETTGSEAANGADSAGADGGATDGGATTEGTTGESPLPALPQKEAEDRINQMIEQTDGIIYGTLADFEYMGYCENVGDTFSVDLTDSFITKAAGMSSSVKTGNEVELWEEVAGSFIDEESLDEQCRNLFGRPANINSLEKYDKSNSLLYDVQLYQGKPMVLWVQVETELAYYTVNTSIEVSGNNYRSIHDVYCGYWGYAQNTGNQECNYEVVIDYERSAESAYGLAITGMHFEKIDDETTWGSDAPAYESTAFYGIWCCATKSETDAIKVMNDLRSKGFYPSLIMSSDYENLNSDSYYVVTSDVYEFEEDALEELAAVKAAGYPNAYIKYTGEYITY